MSNRKGFTMIEMVFVLSVILTLSMITMTLHTPELGEDDLTNKISTFFYKAKLNALTNKEKTTITLKSHKLTYTSENNSETLYITNGRCKTTHTFSYNVNGNIYKAKTIKFVLDGQQVNYVFQVGSGAFEIQ